MWRAGYIYLGRYKNLFPPGGRVEFRVTPYAALANNSDDLAIDDITFRNCNPKSQPPTVTCNFEADLRSCAIWKQSTADDFDWNMGLRSPTQGTGPSYDHTYSGRVPNSESDNFCFELNYIIRLTQWRICNY